MNDTMMVGDVIVANWGVRYIKEIEGDFLYGTSDSFEGEGFLGLASDFLKITVQTELGVWTIAFPS